MNQIIKNTNRGISSDIFIMVSLTPRRGPEDSVLSKFVWKKETKDGGRKGRGERERGI